MHGCLKKIQSDGSLNSLKLGIVGRRDLKNKECSWRHLVNNSLHEEFEIFLGRCSFAQGKIESLRFYWGIIIGKS